jgi:hypothetical protein
MTVRIPAGAAPIVGIILALGAILPAQAQDGEKGPSEPIVVNIEGPCVVALNSQPVQCSGVAYMAFPATGRVDFTAVTDQTGWAFSGDQDANDDGHYTLMLDSVVSPRAGRIQAEGQCEMDIDGHQHRLPGPHRRRRHAAEGFGRGRHRRRR